MIRLLLALVLTSTGWSYGSPAHAQPSTDTPRVGALGWARAIPRSRSADRDAPAFQLVVAPRPTMTAATEISFFSVVDPRSIGFRLGFYGLIEIEAESAAVGSRGPWPTGDVHFWRGSYGFSTAFSLDEPSSRLCDGCLVEATLMFRHESDHYTGDNRGITSSDYGGSPQRGNFFVPDVAFRYRSSEWHFIGRAQVELFIQDGGAYAVSPGADLQLRWMPVPFLHPFVSAFAEYAVGTRFGAIVYPDAYLVRGMLGVAFPSEIGDVSLFVSADVGHRKGLAALTEEATVGGGIRFSLGAL